MKIAYNYFYRKSGHQMIGFRKRFIITTTLVIMILIVSSCKKAVQVPLPAGFVTGSFVYSSNSTASAAVTAIYSNMMTAAGTISGGPQSIGSLSGLSADELQCVPNSDPLLLSAYTNTLINSNDPSGIWYNLYQYIYYSNAVLEGLASSTGVTLAIKQQLSGEAEFIRAFSFFYLVNSYGDVPLVTTTNYQTNAIMSRTPKAQVYQQIIADLVDAQNKLSVGFVDGNGKATTERTRPNQGAAAALLARVYLYYGNLTGDGTNYKNAETEATLVIGNAGLYSIVPNLNKVFLANSTEAIWQLQPVSTNVYATFDGNTYILTTGPNTGNNPLFLSTPMLSAFEAGDTRKVNWISSFTTATVPSIPYYYPYKYKVAQGTVGNITEYEMVLRLAEQYLVRAEARAQQGNISGGQNDLNVIRTRAGLPNTTAATQAALLAAILHERQVELFTEFGHRWMDLKRTGNLDGVMGSPGGISAAKGGTWSSYKALFPIDLGELQLDPFLQQNNGY